MDDGSVRSRLSSLIWPGRFGTVRSSPWQTVPGEMEVPARAPPSTTGSTATSVAPRTLDDATRMVPQQSNQQSTGDETRVMPAGAPRESRTSRPVPPNIAPPPRTGSGSSWRSRLPRPRLRWLWILLLLWLVFLIAIPIWAWTTVDKVDAEPAGTRPDEQPGTTYLVVGSDRADDLTAEQREVVRAGQRSGGRTDTIMVLHTGDGPNLLMSIPRDSIVDIPGQG